MDNIYDLRGLQRYITQLCDEWEVNEPRFYDGLIQGLMEREHGGVNNRHALCGLKHDITQMYDEAKTREKSGAGETCDERNIYDESCGLVGNIRDLRGLQRHITKQCGNVVFNRSSRR